MYSWILNFFKKTRQFFSSLTGVPETKTKVAKRKVYTENQLLVCSESCEMLSSSLSVYLFLSPIIFLVLNLHQISLRIAVHSQLVRWLQCTAQMIAGLIALAIKRVYSKRSIDLNRSSMLMESTLEIDRKEPNCSRLLRDCSVCHGCSSPVF